MAVSAAATAARQVRADEIDESSDLIKGQATVRGCQRFCIGFQIVIFFGGSLTEQRKSVIEDRCRRHDFTGMIVTQNTEVTKMAILIVHKRIKDQHI